MKEEEEKKRRELKEAVDLGKRAEAKLREVEGLEELSAEDIQLLIHALRVHQVELEVQNEELRKAQAQLEESRNKYSDLYDFAPVGYFTFDEKGLILEVNLTGANQLEVERTHLKLKSFSDYVAEEDQSTFLLHLRLVLESETQQACEIKLLNQRKGSSFYARLESLSAQEAGGGRVCRTSISDITERKRAEETIQHLAYYDPLTDLPNRTLFHDRLNQALVRARRSHQKLAVMFLDLDRFKIVNDTLGHAIGDCLLQGVARRLISCIRETDTLARLGGDEFMLLLPGISCAEDAIKAAQRILETFRPPFYFDGRELHVTLSLGIALFPNDGEDVQTLLKNADIAMYRAKEQGRNNYQFYTPAMNAAALERLALENNLRWALERREFVVHYQPQVDLRTGQIIGMEALIRWKHPELGLISPRRIIPLAEETDLIVPISEWVLYTACSQNKAWQKAGLPPVRMAVNLSARHFKHKDFLKTIAYTLRETGLDPGYLDLELTEGVLMENVEATATTLLELKAMGVHLSMDDFGTGYSSLNYLKRFPLNLLKIDRSFVQNVTTDSEDAAIVRLIVDIAHSLKLKAIAEGVETEEQLLFLRTHRCDAIQGYYFSRPVPAQVATQIIQEDRRLTPEEGSGRII